MLGACQIKVYLQQLPVSLSSLFPHVGMDNSVILKLVLPLLFFVFTCQTVPFSISLNPPPFVILFLSMSRVRRCLLGFFQASCVIFVFTCESTSESVSNTLLSPMVFIFTCIFHLSCLFRSLSDSWRSESNNGCTRLIKRELHSASN